MSEHLPSALALQVGGRSEIAIRAARPGDAAVIRRLAQLVDRTVPADPMLVAESDGLVVAALSLSSDGVVTDPFRATADLVELLHLRAAQLHAIAA
jgi:hypothetical protein